VSELMDLLLTGKDQSQAGQSGADQPLWYGYRKPANLL